jgi:hypothetical protein
MKAKPSADPWHFARPELAQAYLQTFDLGLVSAKALFAKRRFGKSEFLEKDLIPAAQAAGYLTAYVNLWDNREHPAAALLDAVGRVTEPKGLAKLLKGLHRPVKSVKASGKLPAGLGEGALEAELASEPQARPVLTQLLRDFGKSGGKLLLLLDEAHVLAEPTHSTLTHALRAALDSQKRRIKVVFAGSSEATLRRMFGRPSEPFYNWAALEPFPLLGAEFVDALVRRTNALTRYPLALKDALAAFDALNRTPEFFRRYLSGYLSNPDLGPVHALQDTREHVFSDATFAGYWRSLLPADREVLKLLACGATEMHSVPVRQRLGRALGLEKAVPAYTTNNSLQRLQNDGAIARMDRGEYRFEDDAFAEWVRNRGLEGQ